MNFIQQTYATSKDAASAYYNKDAEFDSYIQEQLNEKESAPNSGSRIERGYVTLNNAQDMNDTFDFIKEPCGGGYTNYAQEATKNIHSESNLGRVYFSRDNIDLLQDMIRYQIYEQSKHVVSRQSDTELEVIMRHFYLTYGKNLPDRITEQVAELNTYVVNECVPMIISSVEQYLAYRLRITQKPQIMNLPQNVSQKGSKTLQPNHWI
jgi:hypothetical protein